MSNSASKRFLIAAIAVIVLLMVIVTLNLPSVGDNDYLIGKNGDYVICEGERYIPAGEGFEPDGPTDRIIAENVPIEGGDLLDRYFIYGYLIYRSQSDDSVIYVHTAESAGVSGYFVRESVPEY